MFWYLITCLHMRLSKLMTWSARGNICRLFGYPAIQPAVYRSDESILPGLSDGLRGDFIPGMGMWIPRDLRNQRMRPAKSSKIKQTPAHLYPNTTRASQVLQQLELFLHSLK